jgi:hypothetical protein
VGDHTEKERDGEAHPDSAQTAFTEAGAAPNPDSWAGARDDDPDAARRDLVDTNAREVRARRDLALALVRAEQRYALAAHRLEEFDDYLRGLRARLRDAGYLSSAKLATR